MIHYGTQIAYTYEIIPNSSKNYYGIAHLSLGGHSGFLKTYHKVKKEIFGWP